MVGLMDIWMDGWMDLSQIYCYISGIHRKLESQVVVGSSHRGRSGHHLIAEVQ